MRSAAHLEVPAAALSARFARAPVGLYWYIVPRDAALTLCSRIITLVSEIPHSPHTLVATETAVYHVTETIDPALASSGGNGGQPAEQTRQQRRLSRSEEHTSELQSRR